MQGLCGPLQEMFGKTSHRPSREWIGQCAPSCTKLRLPCPCELPVETNCHMDPYGWNVLRNLLEWSLGWHPRTKVRIRTKEGTEVICVTQTEYILVVIQNCACAFIRGDCCGRVCIYTVVLNQAVSSGSWGTGKPWTTEEEGATATGGEGS